jgi:hypothetical protein
MGIEKPSFDSTLSFSNPTVILNLDDYTKLLRELNSMQRQIFLNLICLFKNNHSSSINLLQVALEQDKQS